MTLLKFFNMAILPLLVNFKYDNKVLNAFGILNGYYSNFDVEWYRRIGAQYALTLWFDAFIPPY